MVARAQGKCHRSVTKWQTLKNGWDEAGGARGNR